MSIKFTFLKTVLTLVSVGLIISYVQFNARVHELSNEARRDWKWTNQFINLGSFCRTITDHQKQDGSNPDLDPEILSGQDWWTFVDPDTQLKYSWIVFSIPVEQMKVKGKRFPIAAAPRWGPERTKGLYCRMVGFSDYGTEWVKEEDFVEMIKLYPISFAFRPLLPRTGGQTGETKSQ